MKSSFFINILRPLFYSYRFSARTTPGYLRMSNISRTITNIASLVTSDLEKPIIDDRTYRVITLANKLEALLVHDAETDKASAALDVNAGSYADPKELPGLAHFCEHLLFMGTEKYPSENEYSQYLSEHSGYSNAYTSSEDTNYYFEVASDYLEGALDRFSQFFVAPLFSPDANDREILAVDSENKKNLQNDLWRLYQLDKSLSNPDHPYNRFSTGNVQTLDILPKEEGIDVREQLLEYYRDYYSANIMKLVIVGKESLDTLEQWVIEKFSAIRNYDRQISKYASLPLTKNELGRFISAKPVMDTKQLTITFPIPDQRKFYPAKPASYYSHLIGHEGPGSLFQYLKKRSLITSLSAGSEHVANGADFFNIDVELTDTGLERYKEVMVAVFEFLSLLRATSAQKWIYEELRDVAAMKFKFMQKLSPAETTSKLASVMQRREIPRDHLLSFSLLRDYNPKLINEFSSYLDVDNFRHTLVAQSLTGLDLREKWYGTEYSLTPIDPDLKKILQSVGVNKELQLPNKNVFIPQSFDLVGEKTKDPFKQPTLLRKTDQLLVWHKTDDTFGVPKADIHIFLKSPVTSSSPGNMVRANMFIQLVNDSLVEFAYDAEIAGLKYDVTISKGGIGIFVGGFNDKLSLLLDKIVDRFMNFTVNEDRFKVLQEKLLRGYKNFGYTTPYQQIATYSHYLLHENVWDTADKERELEILTAQEITDFIPEILRQFDVEVMVIGNYAKDATLKIAEKAFSQLKPGLLAPAQRTEGRAFWLGEGTSSYYVVDLKDRENLNSCIEYFLQVGKLTEARKRAVLDVMTQIASEPAFNILRTKEQLGYVVFGTSKLTRTTMGYRVLIQSERSTEYLEHRIDNFFQCLETIIVEMGDKEYKGHVEALIARKLEKKRSLTEEGDRYWSRIRDGYYNFLQHETESDIAKTITKEEVLEFLRYYISPSSKHRSKLVVHLKSQVKKDDSVTGYPDGKPVTDVGVFRSQLSLTEAPTPSKDLSSYMEPEPKL